MSYRPLPTLSDIVICRAIVRTTNRAGPLSESFMPSVISVEVGSEGKFVMVVLFDCKPPVVPSSRLFRGELSRVTISDGWQWQ